ncbi:MAG: HRDC domain-containing protein [Planctomycetaceae bacterium]
MTTGLIADQKTFDEFCNDIRRAGIVAFDTEFVSEHTLHPELGLLQFATDKQCLAVDPYAVEDLSAWWSIMTDDKIAVVVHGGQAEIRFCLKYAGQRPRNLIDVQLAEGFQSRSYPLGYSALVQRVLGKRIHGKETRTDWRKRPLSQRQIDYALEDVVHLPKIWRKQEKSLRKLGRLEWVRDENEALIEHALQESEREAWVRLPGLNRLSRREFAVARELAEWRASEAEKSNRPLKRLIRDDLIIELAKRQPRTMKDLMATRDMNRTNYRRNADDFLKCIERALSIPEKDLPIPPRREKKDRSLDEQILGQFLGLALANRCAECNLSRQLVGTSADLRQLVRWHLAGEKEDAPKLATGWRAEVCGDLLTDVLEGRIALHIADPTSDHPLVFDRIDERQ